MIKTTITDISHWQGLVNWSVASGFMKATIAKATEHISLLDSQWSNNKAGCLNIGLPFGAYHFFRPNYDPIQQAKFHLNTAGDHCNVFVCDVETPLLILAAEMLSEDKINGFWIETDKSVMPPIRGQADWTDLQTALVWNAIGATAGIEFQLDTSPEEISTAVSLPGLVEAYCDYILANRPGAKVGIYTSPYFWKTFMKYPDGTYPNWTRKYFLWIAHYYVTTPIIPPPWIEPKIHQYTDKLVIPGIDSSSVDGDWFYGDESQCSAFFGNAGIPVEPEPPVDPIPDTVTVTASVLYLRNEPTSIKGSLSVIGNTTLGKVLSPEGAEYDASGGKWWKLGRRIYCAAWLTK